MYYWDNWLPYGREIKLDPYLILYIHWDKIQNENKI